MSGASSTDGRATVVAVVTAIVGSWGGSVWDGNGHDTTTNVSVGNDLAVVALVGSIVDEATIGLVLIDGHSSRGRTVTSGSCRSWLGSDSRS